MINTVDHFTVYQLPSHRGPHLTLVKAFIHK